MIMVTLMIAAAAAAAQPATQAAASPQIQQGQPAEHKDCCKDCCKDMADKQGGHGSERGGHAGHGDHAE
jgi:Ni/Co efflux regulator RcnB